MKLQVSFDMPDIYVALHTARAICNHVDIIEIGTILLYKYGIDVIKQFKDACPDVAILVDTKIVDRGRTIVPLFAEAQPDWITVMAGTSNQVIHATCVSASDAGIKVMLDLLDSNSVGQSAMEAKNLGVDALMFHESYEQEGSLVFLDKWDMIKGNTDLPVFVSAKIDRENFHEILSFKPDGIIVGNSITNAHKPEEEAKYFYETCCK